MTDYLSRDAAILEIQRHGVGCFDQEAFTPEQAERFVISRLKSIPAADVVPVVRCRDCRFARFGPNWISCENFNGLCTTALGLEDFCSHGERSQQDGKL